MTLSPTTLQPTKVFHGEFAKTPNPLVIGYPDPETGGTIEMEMDPETLPYLDEDSFPSLLSEAKKGLQPKEKIQDYLKRNNALYEASIIRFINGDEDARALLTLSLDDLAYSFANRYCDNSPREWKDSQYWVAREAIEHALNSFRPEKFIRKGKFLRIITYAHPKVFKAVTDVFIKEIVAIPGVNNETFWRYTQLLAFLEEEGGAYGRGETELIEDFTNSLEKPPSIQSGYIIRKAVKVFMTFGKGRFRSLNEPSNRDSDTADLAEKVGVIEPGYDVIALVDIYEVLSICDLSPQEWNFAEYLFVNGWKIKRLAKASGLTLEEAKEIEGSMLSKIKGNSKAMDVLEVMGRE